MVSNIVYVIFAFLLIIIAFMNIIGRWDQWELKQALPKFVIWVLIVPFSWLFVQFVIAISSFLSVSVLMLPYDVLSNSPKSGWSEISEKPVCTKYIVVSKQEWTNNKEVSQSWCGWETKVGDLLTSNGIYGLLNIYTYGIFSIDDLSKLNGQEISTFSSLFKISMNLLLVLLLAIVYFVLMVSLFLALFVRWIWLWMYMVFSPVFGLLFFFGKSKENGFMDGKFSISEFISLAMVPVYVSAALAFGLVFIFVAGTSFSSTENDSSGFIDFSEKPVTSTTGDYTGSWQELTANAGNGTRITVLWKFQLDMYGDISTSGSQTDGLFEVMKSGFWTLLMQLFGLAVLWVAVMTAINQSKITQAVVEPIAGFGKQVGGLIQKSPQYAPIFGGQSMQSIQQVGGKITGAANQVSIDKANTFAKKLPFLNESSVDRTSKLQEISNRIENNYGDNTIPNKSLRNEFIEILKAADGDASNMVNSPEFKKAFQSLGKKVGLTPWDIANFDFRDESKIADTVIRQIEGKFDEKTIWLLDWVWKNGWTFWKSELSDLVESVQSGEIKWGTNWIDDKIVTKAKQAWNVNYYDINIGWDSVANVSDGKIVEIPWLMNIEQQISKISAKLSDTYKWDINNSEKLKQHIKDELYITDDTQIDTIIDKITNNNSK